MAPGGRVIGVDASAAMVEEARRRGGGDAVEFAVADAARLGLPDGSADGARCERTLQHVARPADAIGEMARVVRPGGRVVAAEPDWGTLVADPGDPDVCREVARAAAERVRSGTVGRALRGLLMDAGLEEVGVIARTLVVAGAEQAGLVFDTEGALAAAVEAGRVTAAQAERWRDAERRAADRGARLAAMTAFMAWGRVPPPRR